MNKDVRRKFDFGHPQDTYWNETLLTSSVSDASAPESTPLFHNYVSFFDGDAEESFIETDSFSHDTYTSHTSTSLQDKVSKNNYSEPKDKDDQICCSSQSQPPPNESTLRLDYNRLMSEHKKLQKYFEDSQEKKYITPPDEILRRLTKCKSVSLDNSRTKQQKLELLKMALESFNWDVVVTIILFLKRTFSVQVFKEVLLENPSAVEYYLGYLRETNDVEELMNTLLFLGRTDEAAILEISNIAKFPEKVKIEALKKYMQSSIPHPLINREIKFLHEYMQASEKNSDLRK